MCAGCLSSLDATVFNAIGASALTSVGLTRLRGRFGRRSEAERRVRSWERDASFCELLQLDPVAVLGASPAGERVESR